MIALATRYDVSAHVASSIVADRLPAMCGSDTLTTVVSSTSMKVREHHGDRDDPRVDLTVFCHRGHVSAPFSRVTDMPGRRMFRVLLLVERDRRTGTRCTTFARSCRSRSRAAAG